MEYTIIKHTNNEKLYLTNNYKWVKKFQYNAFLTNSRNLAKDIIKSKKLGCSCEIIGRNTNANQN